MDHLGLRWTDRRVSLGGLTIICLEDTEQARLSVHQFRWCPSWCSWWPQETCLPEQAKLTVQKSEASVEGADRFVRAPSRGGDQCRRRLTGASEVEPPKSTTKSSSCSGESTIPLPGHRSCGHTAVGVDAAQKRDVLGQRLRGSCKPQK
jgi:hypothetical protein